MAIRSYKPTSPGRRAGQVSDFAELTDKKRRPTKALLEPKPKTGGRNHHGKITSWWRGGGHKQLYRKIDFKRRNDSGRATVVATCQLLAVSWSLR